MAIFSQKSENFECFENAQDAQARRASLITKKLRKTALNYGREGGWAGNAESFQTGPKVCFPAGL